MTSYGDWVWCPNLSAAVVPTHEKRQMYHLVIFPVISKLFSMIMWLYTTNYRNDIFLDSEFISFGTEFLPHALKKQIYSDSFELIPT